MTRLAWKQKKLSGTIHLPGSKSISNRLLIINYLLDKKTKISNLSLSDDTQNLSQQLRKIENTTAKSLVIDVGAAGTNMRFLTALLATIPNKEFTLTGSKRMCQRPIKPLVDALQSLGAEISYLEQTGFPPLNIKGKEINGGTVKINANISSQFISALMLIAPTFPLGLEIQLKQNPISSSYISMTKEIMQQFGAEVVLENKNIFVKARYYQPKDKITVESDWSAASYWYGMLTLSELGELKINNLQKNSWQGDAIIKEWAKDFGIHTQFLSNNVLLSKIKTEKITSFEKDFSSYPDLAQTFTVLLSALQIKAKLTGLSTLKVKETDRILALEKELKRFGIEIHTTDDSIEICPSSLIHSEHAIKTYDDHRMAMSMAMLVMIFKEITIENEDVVSKSYPNFWKDLESVGFEITPISS